METITLSIKEYQQLVSYVTLCKLQEETMHTLKEVVHALKQQLQTQTELTSLHIADAKYRAQLNRKMRQQLQEQIELAEMHQQNCLYLAQKLTETEQDAKNAYLKLIEQRFYTTA